MTTAISYQLSIARCPYCGRMHSYRAAPGAEVQCRSCRTHFDPVLVRTEGREPLQHLSCFCGAAHTGDRTELGDGAAVLHELSSCRRAY